MNRKKHRRKRKKTCFCYSSRLGNGSNCNTLIALSLFLILIVVVTIAALAIYIGMEIILDGSLRITYGDYYTSELYNKTSQLFLTKAHTYKLMIEKVFVRSILGPSVKQCIVMGFRNGSLIVFYRLILDRRKIPSRIFANIEETASKILYEEITSLKPAIFTSVRLDPKQIVIKKHSLNVEPSHGETNTAEHSIHLEDRVSAANHHHHTNVIRPSTHATSPILRRKTPAPIISTTTLNPRTKVTKKNRPANSADKSTKVKPQLDSVRSPILLFTGVTTASTISKPLESKRPANHDANDGANRYSFVSEDADKIEKVNSTKVHILGEAEVIVVPATADDFEPDGVERLMPSVFVENSTAQRRKSPTETGRRVDHDPRNVTMNATLLSASRTPRPELTSKMPVRSNIALHGSLRPKPTIPTTTEKVSKNNIVTEDEWVQTTENALIVLNTEVVTSTSMKISYGEGVLEDQSIDELQAAPVITHNLRTLSELTSTLEQPPRQAAKYKTIFPRSIRDVGHQRNSYNNGDKTTRDAPPVLSSMVEIYKRKPSNETLHLILQQLASIYTKSTQSIAATKPHTIAFTNAGELMTRPMHRISTSTEPTRNVSVCHRNSTKQCANGQCIMQHLWCNQFADCNDNSDERNCTCADYLRAQFASDKICDGIVDCWDFSDESRCEWCSPNMFVCANAKVCVEQSKVCDGRKDCPTGDDEKNCITISPSHRNNDDVSYHSTGVVTVKRDGLWGKLCFEKNTNESTEQTFKKLQELGKAVCKIMTFKRFTELKIIRDSESNGETTYTPIYYRLTQILKNNTNSFRRKNFKFIRTSCSSGQVIRVSCSSLECGIQTQIGNSRARGRYRGDRQSRIVGGGSAALGAWPWQAALYKEGEFQCGATLISNKWLLSAGHCFNNALHEYWVARLGILRRSSTLPSPHEQIRPIRRIIVHPEYADIGFINDIALLELSSEVQFTNYVRPICVPPPNRELLDGTLCTVIGWGQLMESGGSYPDTLQEVQLPVISRAECHKRTALLPLYNITDGMLCAGYDRGGRDACLGDSGGPLMCQNGDSWHLYGVTSNGNGCARAHRPGVYTKVADYVNWIEEKVKITNLSMKQVAGAGAGSGSRCTGLRCPLGECLPKARICNGYMECSDGSDERGC